MPLPSVSIVVCTHNRPASLDRLMAAIEKLNYPAELVETVVVDDGSSPAARPITGNARVRLIRQERMGPACARNRGIREATGEFVAITDDDCCPHADWLMKLCEVYRLHPDALVGGRTVNTLTKNVYATASQALIDYLYVALGEGASTNQFFTTSNVGGARQRFFDIGGFDESFPLPAAEDRDLCDRWRAMGRLVLAECAVVEHSHTMSLAGFVRQHFRYGRGARILHGKRAAQGFSAGVEGIGFYGGMLAYPFRRGPFGEAVAMSLLFVVAQGANLLGYVYQAGKRPGGRAANASFGR